ncbi:MAG: hypothetical protein QOD65_460 [Gaiellales bacterium]|jgi:hypothetical protein|nr:hypothetical protein [Gaiellales bacterium]
MSARARGTVELVLEHEQAAPGEVIHGRLSPGALVWAVDLVRVESSPEATLEFTAASVEPQADGTFALTVPDGTPPSVSGRVCALTWRVRARTREDPQPGDTRRTLEIACPS